MSQKVADLRMITSKPTFDKNLNAQHAASALEWSWLLTLWNALQAELSFSECISSRKKRFDLHLRNSPSHGISRQWKWLPDLELAMISKSTRNGARLTCTVLYHYNSRLLAKCAHSWACRFVWSLTVQLHTDQTLSVTRKMMKCYALSKVQSCLVKGLPVQFLPAKRYAQSNSHGTLHRSAHSQGQDSLEDRHCIHRSAIWLRSAGDKGLLRPTRHRLPVRYQQITLSLAIKTQNKGERKQIVLDEP